MLDGHAAYGNQVADMEAALDKSMTP